MTPSRGVAAASADRLATGAAMDILDGGGNAVDAALAANAVLAVTAPHLCGMGGDLFALVHRDGEVACLNASGRAGSGADPVAMRRAGLVAMPMRHDIRSVTVPGCVDGWIALHDRYATRSLDDLLAPAIAVADGGYPASPLLVGSLGLLDPAGRASLSELAGQATTAGATIRRPGVARALRAVARRGRAGFYGGDVGDGLLTLGGGWFHPDDLAAAQAEWVEPLSASAFGVRLWTVPPNSQGYLLLGAARLADAVGLPDDPGDPMWAHLLIECAIAAGHDRPAVLADGADGVALVEGIARRAAMVGRRRARRLPFRSAPGDTTYLCTADAAGMVVSLIQSNASGFGSWLVEPSTGINLHNRGIGFTLQPDHPGELGPGRRPPHTLAPALATAAGGRVAALGTMGGDAQPQIVLQLAARLFRHGQTPAAAVDAGRWVLHGAGSGFDTWTGDRPPGVLVEDRADPAWAARLRRLGHRVTLRSGAGGGFGHAHVVAGTPGRWQAAADPRAIVGLAATR